MTQEDATNALNKLSKPSVELSKILSGINKHLGDGLVTILGAREKLEVETIPTGSLILDFALGVGGFPQGRILELYGLEASGKTSIALFCIAATQKQFPDKFCGIIDVEHSLDPLLAQKYGVDLSSLAIAQPDYGEQALQVMEDMVLTGKFSVIVLDSVAALTPKAELEGSMEDQQMGLQARLMGKALRKLAGIASQSKTTLIFINQVREQLGTYGSPKITPAGKALKFYSSIRLDTRRGDYIKIKDDTIGHVLKFKVTKNKVATPYKTGEFNLIYGKGIDSLLEAVEIAITTGLITRAGAWYTYNTLSGEEHRAQGKVGMQTLLQEHPEILTEIKERLFSLEEVLEEVVDLDEEQFGEPEFLTDPE